MKLNIFKNKKFYLTLGSVVLASFLLAGVAQAAGFGDAVATVVGWIVYGFVFIVGQILLLMMWILVKIAQVQNFTHSSAVVQGWVIVRDLCNMFFILILLLIAFAIILRVDGYSLKKQLPKLIMMAVLVNFSKTICGVLIDFAQVIMLTFVNGFKEVAGGNLVNMLGIDKLLSLDTTNSASGDVSTWSVLGSYILALIYSVIALITITAMVAMLVMRMIMIWVYVVLSPLAYLLAAFPQGKSYADQWWDEFTKNLVVGPILAFFIWLSFASLGTTSPKDISDISGSGKAAPGTKLTASSTGPSAGITQAGSPDNMIKFIISIGMLIGGMEIAQSMGGRAGKMAGQVSGSLNKFALSRAKRISGVERAQMAMKKIQSHRQTLREEKAGVLASQIMTVQGKVKTTIGAGYQKLAGGIKQINPLQRYGRQAAEHEAAARGTRSAMGEMKSGLDSGRLNEWTKNAATQQWEKKEGVQWTRNAATKEWEQKDKNGKVLAAKTEKDFRTQISSMEGEATQLENEAAEKRTTQAKVDKYSRMGLGAAGLGLSLVPGVGPAGIIMMAAAAGGKAANKGIKDWGKKDVEYGDHYKSSAINTQREKMKLSSIDQLREEMTNESDPIICAAANIEAISRGELSNNEAQVAQDRVGRLTNNDAKTKTLTETALAKNYLNLTPTFRDASLSDKDINALQTDDEKTKARDSRTSARAKIVGGLKSGSYTLDSLNEKTLEDQDLYRSTVLSSLTADQIVKQHQGIKSQYTKDTNIQSLEQTAFDPEADAPTKAKAREALFKLKGSAQAFSDVDTEKDVDGKMTTLTDEGMKAREEVFGKLNVEQINGILSGSAENEKAEPFMEAIKLYMQKKQADTPEKVTAALSSLFKASSFQIEKGQGKSGLLKSAVLKEMNLASAKPQGKSNRKPAGFNNTNNANNNTNNSNNTNNNTNTNTGGPTNSSTGNITNASSANTNISGGKSGGASNVNISGSANINISGSSNAAPSSNTGGATNINISGSSASNIGGATNEQTVNRSQAQRTTVRGFAGGASSSANNLASINLNVSGGGSSQEFQSAIQQMDSKDFSGQFRNLTDDNRKESIVKALKADTSFPSREKLFHVQGLGAATEGLEPIQARAYQNRIFANMKTEDLQQAVAGSDDASKSLLEALKKELAGVKTPDKARQKLSNTFKGTGGDLLVGGKADAVARIILAQLNIEEVKRKEKKDREESEEKA